MTGDASIFTFRDEEARQIAEDWRSNRRRPREHLDFAGVVHALLASFGGGPAAGVRLASVAAGFAAAYASEHGTFPSLIADIDDLETMLLTSLGERATKAAASVVAFAAAIDRLHARAALARRAAAAGFGQAVSAVAKQSARTARHDIANAIGAVRNAVLLLEDERANASRETLQAIMRRNSQRSETLVRSYLSDHAALTAAVGWEPIETSWLSARDRGDGGDGSVTPVIVHSASLDLMLDAVHLAMGHRVKGTTAPLPAVFSRTSATVGCLTVRGASPPDHAADAETLTALAELAKAVGFSVDGDVASGEVRVTFPLSGGDERNDLGGSGEGQHLDAVRL
jgi:hypothetical protein